MKNPVTRVQVEAYEVREPYKQVNDLAKVETENRNRSAPTNQQCRQFWIHKLCFAQLVSRGCFKVETVLDWAQIGSGVCLPQIIQKSKGVSFTNSVSIDFAQKICTMQPTFSRKTEVEPVSDQGEIWFSSLEQARRLQRVGSSSQGESKRRTAAIGSSKRGYMHFRFNTIKAREAYNCNVSKLK